MSGFFQRPGLIPTSFSVHKNGSGQTINNGEVNNLITWAAEVYDVGSYFDLANNKYLPLVSGKYHFDIILTMGAEDGKEFIIKLFKNGAVAAYKQYRPGSGAANIGLSLSVDVEANGTTDYFEVQVSHNATSNESMSGATNATTWHGHIIELS